ncbi:NAD regulator [Vulcanimicrobium alpinum]|uniref:NAD regulator n=1 Tax=Vulcanimicrobium alpinum TaxID=3016050 RepID=A0AAN2C9Q6_UNVUL|nr:hypothetical protein [Vulcanimicrobium alpinum]BDE06780.1 NAD regulator [Vulcanimicrobium alpinum]
MRHAGVRLQIDAVIVSVAGETPRVLTVAGAPRLPSGDFAPETDRTLELAARRLIGEQTGLRVGYLEQLYTFGDRDRDPREAAGGPRLVSVGYLALVGVDAAHAAPSGVAWHDWYAHLPWEDQRADAAERTAAARFVRARSRRGDAPLRERARVLFGIDGAAWNDEAVLERYELLYELGAVAEAGGRDAAFGMPMELDHRRILATAIGRIRGKIAYRPIVFELVPGAFSLSELQHTVEALAGRVLHGPNFRRLVEDSGIVEETGERRPSGGRPAKIYRFRPDVLAERPDPGIGIR